MCRAHDDYEADKYNNFLFLRNVSKILEWCYMNKQSIILSMGVEPNLEGRGIKIHHTEPDHSEM